MLKPIRLLLAVFSLAAPLAFAALPGQAQAASRTTHQQAVKRSAHHHPAKSTQHAARRAHPTTRHRAG